MRGGKASCRDFVVALTALTAFSASLSASQPKPVFMASILSHATLGVSDVKKSCASYQRVFGLCVLHEDDDGCNLTVDQL